MIAAGWQWHASKRNAGFAGQPAERQHCILGHDLMSGVCAAHSYTKYRQPGLLVNEPGRSVVHQRACCGRIGSG
jgi:hypothetical protein